MPDGIGALLRPIATPLILSGFVPEIHDLWRAALDAGHLVPAIGGLRAGTAPGEDDAPPLEPGDPIGASLIQGDLALAGTGTVTLVEEGRVYAFGHPFYNLGHAQLPLTRASVTTLLPSLAISSRLATIGPVVGTIDQDRSTGIYGSLGEGPDLIPVTLSVAGAGRGLNERFRFEIIDDPLFTPILTLTGVLNALVSWTRDVAPSSTYEVAGTAVLGGAHDDVGFRNVFTGQSAAFRAALSATTPLMSLLGNGSSRSTSNASMSRSRRTRSPARRRWSVSGSPPTASGRGIPSRCGSSRAHSRATSSRTPSASPSRGTPAARCSSWSPTRRRSTGARRRPAASPIRRVRCRN